MLFNSIDFLIFFPAVTALYFFLPHKWRWLLLLLASCYFYMSFIPIYIFILAVTILIDYYAGILIGQSEGRRKKAFLVISILSTCSVLFLFKYFNFFNANFYAIVDFFHWNYGIESLKLILPIGLSFHTFQSLSYVIEVYRGRQKVERNFGIYALYVMFYPQLVAGPIERPQNLLHQFYEKHEFEYKRIISGLQLMVWGMFKKVVIADRLSFFVDTVFNNVTGYSGNQFIVASIFFSFQIYCDFSGYSDIARGSARVMGFGLMENFKRPYFSKSILEFWKRWHISLSTWFRDYLYIPLGGNRVSKDRWYFNLFVTFLLSGLWHGAKWNFIIWGALNGFYLIFSIVTKKVREKISNFLWLSKLFIFRDIWQTLLTFFLVLVGWIFFRANNLKDAFYIITHVFTNWSLSDLTIIGRGQFIIAASLIILLLFIEFWQERLNICEFFSKRLFLRWCFSLAIVLGILFFGVFQEKDFIYFQF